MIKNIVAVVGLVSAVVLSGAFVAQADVPAASRQGGPVRAALPGSMAAIPKFSCAGKPDGNYPYPGDDTKFYSCAAHHYAYLRDCSQGQHFDANARECH
jgi:Chitin binding Peritrophin-A domain